MNEYLEKFRAQYPEYDDMSDAELAQALHAKFYADMPYEEFVGRIGLDTGAGRSWGPSPAGRLDEHTRSFGLDPNMSAGEFGDMAAGSVQTALGGRLAQQGLGAAVGAIRTARAARAAPLAAGALPSEYGATVSLATPASRRTALDALRAFVRHPVVKGVRSALPWGGLGYLLNERR